MKKAFCDRSVQNAFQIGVAAEDRPHRRRSPPKPNPWRSGSKDNAAESGACRRLRPSASGSPSMRTASSTASASLKPRSFCRYSMRVSRWSSQLAPHPCAVRRPKKMGAYAVQKQADALIW